MTTSFGLLIARGLRGILLPSLFGLLSLPAWSQDAPRERERDRDRPQERERERDRPERKAQDAPRRPRAEGADEPGVQLGQSFEQAQKAVAELLDQAMRAASREGQRAREELSPEVKERYDQARAQAERAFQEARERMDAALRKAREAAPERERALREQIEAMQERFRREMERRGEPRREGAPDEPELQRNVERLRDVEARLQAQVREAEARLKRLQGAIEEQERRGIPPRGERPDVIPPGRRGEGPQGRAEPAPSDLDQRFRELEKKLERMIDEKLKRVPPEPDKPGQALNPDLHPEMNQEQQKAFARLREFHERYREIQSRLKESDPAVVTARRLLDAEYAEYRDQMIANIQKEIEQRQAAERRAAAEKAQPNSDK